MVATERSTPRRDTCRPARTASFCNRAGRAFLFPFLASCDACGVAMIGGTVTSCRSCASTGLGKFLSLGETPVANALVDSDAADGGEPMYPLEVAFCEECSLVQLAYALPADAIFDDDYPYFSSFSDALCD